MVEIKITIGPGAFDSGHFIYVWLKSNPKREPFYVGETSKSLADRTGLHIRKCGSEARSGAVVGKLMHEGKWPAQEYTVLAFKVSETLLCCVAKENNAGYSNVDKNRSRKAIEYVVYEALMKTYKNMHNPKRAKWKATSAEKLCGEIVCKCIDYIKNNK